MLLLLRAQVLLFRRYPAVLAPYKWVVVALMMVVVLMMVVMMMVVMMKMMKGGVTWCCVKWSTAAGS